MKTRRLFLTGPPCGGKSTLGAYIAAIKGLSYCDLDEAVSRAAGKDIERIFTEEGEEAFRKLEREALINSGADIVACGGGTLINPLNLKYIQSRGMMALLIAKPRILLERLKSGCKRPLLQGDAEARLNMLLAERAYAYCMADMIINTGVLSIEESAGKITAVI